MSNFWHMGGYAFYVWTSYGISAVVLGLGVLKPLWQHKQTLRGLRLKRLRNGQSGDVA